MDTESVEFFTYSFIVVFVFGIIGNILVIISILKQICLLRNNYYVLVLQLAICDLAVLIIGPCFFIVLYWTKEFHNPGVLCVFINFSFLFGFPRVGMMLVISVLRYRATVHPFRPAMSRRKLKVVCGLMYVFGFIVGCGVSLPPCFLPLNNSYYQFSFLFLGTVCLLFSPIFMAVVYYKVGRALSKQSKHMKRLCHADAVKKRHIRDRRTYLICLTTVVCYGIGNLPRSAWYIVLFAAQYHSIQVSVWLFIVSFLLHYTFSFAANPVIYGILDKQLRAFLKCRKPNTPRSQEQLVQQVGETPL